MELTEQRDVGDVTVYGFLRVTNVPKARQTSLLEAAYAYCNRHELRMVGVFTERSSNCPTAFGGLLGALALSGAYGVVIPTPAHLGPRRLGEERRARLREIGVKLLVVRGGRRKDLAPDGAQAVHVAPPHALSATGAET